MVHVDETSCKVPSLVLLDTLQHPADCVEAFLSKRKRNLMSAAGHQQFILLFGHVTWPAAQHILHLHLLDVGTAEEGHI